MYEIKSTWVKPGNNIILPVEVVDTSPYQARLVYPDIEELASSILQYGQQVPIQVWFTPTSPENGATCTDGNRYYKCYCHDGNRRLRAFKLAKEKDSNNIFISKGIRATTIAEPASEVEAVISQYNINSGIGFNAVEELEIVRKLSRAGYTQQEIAQKLNKSQQWVSNILILEGYSKEVLNLIVDNKLSASLAIELLRNAQDKQELETILINKAKQGKVTKKTVEGKIPIKSVKSSKYKLERELLRSLVENAKLRANGSEMVVVIPRTLWDEIESLCM